MEPTTKNVPSPIETRECVSSTDGKSVVHWTIVADGREIMRGHGQPIDDKDAQSYCSVDPSFKKFMTVPDIAEPDVTKFRVKQFYETPYPIVQISEMMAEARALLAEMQAPTNATDRDNFG